MLSLNVSGTWKTVQYAYVNVNGSWKTVAQIYVNASGSWKPIWSYSWSSGSWGSCSADCGGGTQTRTVTCSRNDGQTVSDSICTAMVGTKPSTSQSCNTDACATYGYESCSTYIIGCWSYTIMDAGAFIVGTVSWGEKSVIGVSGAIGCGGLDASCVPVTVTTSTGTWYIEQNNESGTCASDSQTGHCCKATKK